MFGINNSRSWAQHFRFYEQLKVIVSMNDSRLSVEGSRCYEQLRIVDDMNDSRSWAQGFTYYEERGPVVNMNDSFLIGVSADSCPLNGPQQWCHLIRAQLMFLDCGPQGVINKIYNLLHHVLG